MQQQHTLRRSTRLTSTSTTIATTTNTTNAPESITSISTSTSTNSRKRKSVAFDQDPPQQPSTTSTSTKAVPARSSRSRRSSQSTTATASTSTLTAQPPAQPQPLPTLSAKALGKRRAVSPSPPPAEIPSITSSSNKRRKISSTGALRIGSPDPQLQQPQVVKRNLRPRKDSTASSVPSIVITTTTTTSKSEIKKMPRKGSRASRAAKAKAKAVEESVVGGGDGGEGDDVQMNFGDSIQKVPAEENEKKEDEVMVGADSDDEEEEEGEHHVLAESEEGGEGNGDSDSDDSDSEDDDDEDDDDEDDEEGEGQDDEEEEDYELGLEPGYGSGGGESDLIDPPQTFDAEGSRIPGGSSSTSSALLDRAAVEAALDAAEEDAEMARAAAGGRSGGGFFGGLGGGAGFRALQGLMSGMSGRLKTILASLKNKEADATVKLAALQELAEVLSVSTEDTLAGYFQVEAFVKELVIILKGDTNPTSSGGGGGGGRGGGMTTEEMIAFGLDPTEIGGGGGSAQDEENNVQMMLLACRCLANLMEALPGTAHSVVYAGAVPVLCSKLLEIQYIDLAEQTLSTLEKISEEVPSSIVREGGLGALLTYLDFFSFHVQRTAVTAAANCCRSLSPDSFDMVRDATPIFKNVLGYPDQRVVEQACLAITRIVESYRHYPDKLEAILTPDLLAAVRALLNPDSSTVGPGTYTQVLKMLAIAAKASPQVSIALLELNIGNTLYHLLTGVAAPEWEGEEGLQGLKRKEGGDDLLVMQNLVQRPKDQIQETLNLACELLPALPKDGIFDSRAFSGKDRSSSSKHAVVVKREEVTPDLHLDVPSTFAAIERDADAVDVKMEVVDDELPPAPVPSTSTSSAPAPVSSHRIRSSRSKDSIKDATNEKRIELLNEGPASRNLVVKRYFALMLPTLVDVYSASVNTQVRTKAVLGMLKIINFCDAESLAYILKTVSMASFLAAILSSRDQAPLVTNALQLVELLLVKMPDAYQYFFRREGVMHEIERIAAASIVTVSKSKRSSPSSTTAPASPNANAAASSSTSGPSGLARALQQHAASSSSLATTDNETPAVPPQEPPPLPPPTSLTPAEAQAQDMITLRARHLRDKYAAADSEPAVKARSALDNIRRLVQEIHSSSSPTKKVVSEIAALFADEKNPLSSFELLESGLVDGLLTFASESRSTGPSIVERQELLAKAFMPQLDGAASTPAFSLLVKRLQDSLSRMEEFEVSLAAQSSSDLDTRRNGPSMLARQLKLRLVAEDGSDVPRSCTNIVVSIHAIATFQAFNDYLRPRILAASAVSDRSAASRSAPQASAGTLSSFLAAFAAAAEGSSSPPESSALASGSGTRLSSSLGPASNDGPSGSSSQPTRRRSDRLSGKGASAVDGGASTSKSTLDNVESPPTENRPMLNQEEEELCQDEDDEHDDEEELFAEDFDPAPPSRDERTVHLEVNDDKLVAKTPDGTRVGTPTLGKSASSSRLSTAPKARASYAAAVKTEPTDFHLEFSMRGRPVDLETTVFGAVHKYEATTPESRRNMWQSIYNVTFRKVPGAATPESTRASPEPTSRDDSMPTVLPESVPADSPQAKILQLLWVLHSVNSEYGDMSDNSPLGAGLAEAAFTNNKLTAKLNRQLEEPMIVASACLPDWATDLPQSFPFLFPFDTRYAFLQSTAFGYARLMQKWVGQTRTDSSRRDDNLGFLGRLQRQKVRISRERMLESAFKVFELYGSSRASLEVEFFSEVGSGLGPTLEFYALVSKEFARKDLSIWRDGNGNDSSSFVFSPTGLFPSPLVDVSSEAGKKKLKVFRVLGQFVAKALMDSRIIDVHLSRAFMKLVLDFELPLKISTVKFIDKALGRSLAHLNNYVLAKQALDNDESISGEERTAAINAISIDGISVSELVLDFALPGYDIDLKEDGKDIPVDIWNIEEYISLVLEWTLRKGIALQIKEFKSGFSSVFPVRDLQSFTPAELVMLTGAVDEDWSVECLTNAAKADHGFTMDSRSVRDLISIMSEFTLSERRDFLSFITGSPRLPIGGFAALTPTLTIVRKDGGDRSLPSVMTCVNYIKLPDYSNREIVRERIITAVKEGAGGFHLS